MKQLFNLAMMSSKDKKLLLAVAIFLLLVLLKDSALRYVLLGLSSYAFAALLIPKKD